MAFPTILSTTVKNITAATRFYAYLGRHGRYLASGASYTEDGDLIAKLSAPGGKNARLRAALAKDLQGVVASSIDPTVSITRHSIPIDQGDASTIKSIEVNGSNAAAATTVDYT